MMRDDRDYKLDLSSGSHTPAEPGNAISRPFISVHFACCNVYCRIYRSMDGTAYRGRCPRCGKSVSFTVAEGGTDARVFRVY